MGWSRFFRRRHWDDERAAELHAHLAHEIDENVARGMSPDAAARAARRKLGNATRIREEIYEMNTLTLLESAWQDLRFGVRLLIKTPTFTAVAVLTLALGTGANAAIFQLMNAVRLRPLPVERPSELVSVRVDSHGQGILGMRYGASAHHSEPLWQALRREQQAFSSVFAWGRSEFDLSTEGESRPAAGLYVSGGYFDALGVRPHIGRLITEADDRTGCGTPAAVLSYGFWRSRYAGNPAVIGQTIALDRHAFDIVGVAPPAFSGVEVGRTFDVAIPMCAEVLLRDPQSVGTGRAHVWWLDIMGRVKAGWTTDRAAAHLAAISPGVFAATIPTIYNTETAKQYAAFTLTAAAAPTGVSTLRTQYATELWVLLGATGLVLLITCANLANLMLARATARDREIAVRLAIGASRGRIVRQMFSESVLVAVLGAAGGMLLAGWLSQALVLFLSTNSSQIFIDLTPDWRVFAFITAVAAATCLLFGLTPAVQATATAPVQSIQAGGRSTTDAHRAFTLRRGLVVVQVALSLVLVVGALLFARSLRNLASVDVGFRPEGLLSANVDLRHTAVAAEARHEVFQQIAANIRGVPGVRHSAEALIVPLSGPEWNGHVVRGGVQQEGLVYFNQVGGDFFATLGLPLLEGRTFDGRDRDGAPLVAVVNETFARRYLAGVSPIGEVFEVEQPPGRPRLSYQVIGMAKDSKYEDVREGSQAIAYLAFAQEPEPLPFLQVIVRADAPPASFRHALTQAVLNVAPGAVVSYETVDTYLRDAVVTERLMASMSGFFGGLALLIATIGLYGVMAYVVTRRRVEIGIRMALGADPRTIMWMIVREAAVLLALGVVVGVALAALASRWAGSLLYDLTPSDPTSFVLATGALAAVTLTAALIPARRAARVAPTVALRE